MEFAVTFFDDSEIIYFVPVHCVKRVQMRSYFWSVFSRIRTECGEVRGIFPYLVRMRENADQK